MGMVIAGACLVAAGSVLAGGYGLLRTPSQYEIDLHPELEHVAYDIPRWPFNLGVVILVAGLLMLVVGWYSSPRWREGLPLGQWGSMLLASMSLSVAASLAVLVAAGRHSDRLPELLIFTIIVVPLAVAVGTRQWR